MIETLNFDTPVYYQETFPSLETVGENSFLIFDTHLLNKDSQLDSFIQSFPQRYGVEGGESAKDLNQFPQHISEIVKCWKGPISRQHHLVTLGGGSIGDFGGFVASTLKRGLSLVHIPSTWLSAMDSAHGGKTALNLNGVKNQLGTFYPAEKVFIIRPLLQQLGPSFAQQAFGELVKMALVGESQFFHKMMEGSSSDQTLLWEFIKPCVEDKYKVVLQDPFEKKGVRQILNFGHTVGHVLESHFAWSHGESVMQGIFFALRWSLERKHLEPASYDAIFSSLLEKSERSPACEQNSYKPIPEHQFEKLLQADKKINDQGQISFVFLEAIGQPLLQAVSVSELLQEAKRQGWVQ